MSAPGQIDHLLQGIDALPEKGRPATLVAYLTVYLNEFNAQEQVQQDLIQALLYWSRGTPTYSFIYEIIGSILDQPRPDGFDDDQYRFILLARVKVRRSSATLNDVLDVVNYLARGFTFIAEPVVPKAWVIAFFDLGLTTQEKGLYENLLLDTIGQLDKLSLQFVNSGTALYDSLTSTYDTGTYA